jgi:hypothetical protein
MEPTHLPSQNFNRRQFIATTALAGASVLVGANSPGAETSTAASPVIGHARHRYANVGVGSRSGMYRQAILKTYADTSEMVGYCDVNEGRLKLAQRKAGEIAGAPRISVAARTLF